MRVLNARIAAAEYMTPTRGEEDEEEDAGDDVDRVIGFGLVGRKRMDLAMD